MQNRFYDIGKCESILKSEVIKLIIVAVFLVILFVSVIVYSIIQIKNDKSKKLPYIQLVSSAIILVFLSISLGSQILSYTKDIDEKTYQQYEGPAHIRTERQIVLGGIPTGYTEYIISFEQNGAEIELAMRKVCDSVGDVDKIYIVYSIYSNYIIEFEMVE